jgi:hypothetical protein
MRLPAKPGRQQRTEDARALHEQLWDALTGEGGWLPIESAPKDRVVLLYACQFRRHIFGHGYWFQGVPGDGQGWIASADYTKPTDDFRGSFEPTHWMPMFKAPSTPGQKITVTCEDGQAGSDLIRMSSNLHRFWGERGFVLHCKQLADRSGFEAWLVKKDDEDFARAGETGVETEDSVPQGRTRVMHTIEPER